MTDFDAHRALLLRRDIFPPFYVTALRPLRDVLPCGDLGEDAAVLVLERDAFTLVLSTRQLSYHHIAQGEAVGEPWMVSF